MKQYVLGLDFGTLSARALLIDAENGNEIAVSEFVYPHGILTSAYFSNTILEKTAALQHPQDYLDAFRCTVRDILHTSRIDSKSIRGIGIDFTSSTVLPVTENGTPLCFLDEFRAEPQAYVKLWNHHGAQAEAAEITTLAQTREEFWLSRYGGKVSAEWMLPKLYEVLHKAPQVFHKTARYMEAGDWLVWQITGTECHSSCMAGYKALWQKDTGYPCRDFWRDLHPEMADIIGTKIATDIQLVGSAVGVITDAAAAQTGLAPGTTVTAPMIDAHAALPAAGITGSGKLMIILGTSGCHHVLSKERKTVPGICGCVEDGILPGYIAYEGGQTGFGDCFDWFVKNCVPEAYAQEACRSHIDIFTYLNQKAEALDVGENGILVLDWWNGNRTPLADFDLSGMILGFTLKTRPEDIYRGILEATAFGTKAIVDLLIQSGLEMNEVFAAGGISQKNPFLMQIFSDVLGMPIRVTESKQAGAKGVAVFAAVAGGCYPTLEDAASVISDPCQILYTPVSANTQKYAALYQEYLTLTEYFGKGFNNVMKRLKCRK